MHIDSSSEMRNLSLFHSVLHGSSKMGSLGSPRKVRSEESCSVPRPLQAGHSRCSSACVHDRLTCSRHQTYLRL